MQQYKGKGEEPSWLVEGIADFARHKFGWKNKKANWSLGDFQPGQHYTNSYRITARFLVWFEKRSTGAVRKLDRAMRAGNFNSQQTWQRVARAPIDQLWSEYERNPSI